MRWGVGCCAALQCQLADCQQLGTANARHLAQWNPSASACAAALQRQPPVPARLHLPGGDGREYVCGLQHSAATAAASLPATAKPPVTQPAPAVAAPAQPLAAQPASQPAPASSADAAAPRLPSWPDLVQLELQLLLVLQPLQPDRVWWQLRVRQTKR